MSDDSLRGRIRRHILERIEAGDWPPQTKIPSENELAAAFGASRMTVHHALRDLHAEGYLTRAQGLGTFVAPPRAHAVMLRLLDIADEVRGRGGVYEARLIARDLRPASLAEAAVFGAAGPLLHAVVLHLEDGAPVQVEDRLIDPALAPDAATLDVSGQTYFAHLMSRFPYPEGEASIRAMVPEARTANLLGLAPGEPVLEIERLTRESGRVVTVARLSHPASRYALGGGILRPAAIR